MASPYLQQARQRKFIYIALILGLFTFSWVWRYTFIESRARQLAIREDSRGNVELLGSAVRLGLTGSRGIVICVLWSNANDAQKKNQWSELEVLVDSLTQLQPHFITPWLFQSWNLSYNVSVESDRVRDKYFYVAKGIELLSRGEKINRPRVWDQETNTFVSSGYPDLRWSLGFYNQHKICQSDETNYMRSLFQLSLIPPNKRDPARFWKKTGNEIEFNYAEFLKFCNENPQLVRRLRHGIHRETKQEKERLFTCEQPEDVVRFLEDNWDVPSLYEVKPLPANIESQARIWKADTQDRFLPMSERFPQLPEPWKGESSTDALTYESPLSDSTDGFAIAHAWYCFAQQPLPGPGEMPGTSAPITDRTRYRRPKNMTTQIFRNYPAQGRRYMAERLQQEGWYLDDGWNCTEMFEKSRDPEIVGKVLIVGKGPAWSLEAWRAAASTWREIGERNKLLFTKPEDEEVKKGLAARFCTRYNIPLNSAPPELPVKDLPEEEQAEYLAAKYMYEYTFYNNVSNFQHHYNRALVEQKEVTVMCRKLFFDADSRNMAGSPTEAERIYRSPIKLSIEGWNNRSPLEAWRDLVMLANAKYRDDNFNQETTAEYGIRYLWLYNRLAGRTMKDQLVKASAMVPLLPKFDPETFRPPLVEGPFDGEFALPGEPGRKVVLVPDSVRDTVLERMRLPSRRKAAPPPPASMMPDPSKIEPKK